MLVDLTVSYDYGLNSLASVLVGPPWLPTVPLHLELPFNMVLERIFFFFIHTQAGALSNISHFFVLILVPKDLCFIFYQLSFTNMLYQVFLRHICPPLLHFKLSMFFFFFPVSESFEFNFKQQSCPALSPSHHLYTTHVTYTHTLKTCTHTNTAAQPSPT